VVDRSQFSPRILSHEEAQNDDALVRIALGKRRIQNVLDRDTKVHPTNTSTRTFSVSPSSTSWN
jgi:hypothetical protein